MEQQITTTKNQRSFDIDFFIDFLIKEKEKGATHLKFWVTSDPMWRFEWVETFRIKGEEEIKQERIKQIESELNGLKNQ